MAGQLDILALEPFYGGIRKAMLDAVIRCSRHRWTLLKLPPRRIERRLAVAANWFAEQLSRHWVGRVDVIFASEALNLADLFRFVPRLAEKPSIVYFHDNQLPRDAGQAETAHDLVNLNSAAAANEIWFNSLYHLRSFLNRASAIVQRHPELKNKNPLPALAGRAHVFPPPMNLRPSHPQPDVHQGLRVRRQIFVETRDADVALLNTALAMLGEMEESFELVTVGPVEQLDPALPRRTIPEQDEAGQFAALREAGVVLSVRRGAPCDHHVLRGLALGCWPVLPRDGAYLEILPDSMHAVCLYENTPDSLANRLRDHWRSTDNGEEYRTALDETLHRYDALPACRILDQHLADVAAGRSARR